jgi:hypothetical protein
MGTFPSGKRKCGYSFSTAHPLDAYFIFFRWDICSVSALLFHTREEEGNSFSSAEQDTLLKLMVPKSLNLEVQLLIL